MELSPPHTPPAAPWRARSLHVPSAKTAIAGTNPATGTARYYFHDHLGSTRRLYSATRTLLGTYRFTPYGSVQSQSGAALDTLGGTFTGKPWDSTAQLYYFPYRYYSPTMARWTSRDPLGMVDGPNMYGYVRGNPMNRVDPLGLWAVELICSGIGYFGGKIEGKLSGGIYGDYKKARDTIKSFVNPAAPSGGRSGEKNDLIDELTNPNSRKDPQRLHRQHFYGNLSHGLEIAGDHVLKPTVGRILYVGPALAALYESGKPGATSYLGGGFGLGGGSGNGLSFREGAGAILGCL